MSNLVYPNFVAPQAHGNSRAVRQHNQAMRYVDHQAAVAVRQIQNVNHAARVAMFEAMQTGLARRTAELAVPEQADLLQAINLAAGFVSVSLISGMHRG